MAMQMWNALPRYFGGKRKLVGNIFKLIPPASEAPVLMDCFHGGGSVGLYAKARGYRVLVNDLAERSVIIGKALIENNRTKLTEMDVKRLYRAATAGVDGFASRNFVPDLFLPNAGHAIDGITAELESWDGPKRDLGRLLLVKYIFSLRPFSKFSAKESFTIPIADRRIEYVNRIYSGDVKSALRPIIDTLQLSARRVNAGVLDNGQVNQATRGDVLHFLAGNRADVAYFDPPYAETLSYEEEYNVLDQVLEQRQFPPDKSGFSTDDWRKFMRAMFDAGSHIPMWVLSFGSAGGKIGLGELVDLMARGGRKITAYRLKYAHIAAVASAEHQDKNEEYIIVSQAG